MVWGCIKEDNFQKKTQNKLFSLRLAGPCGYFAVRAVRSPNPTAARRAHHVSALKKNLSNCRI
jgi:hypothetical protein